MSEKKKRVRPTVAQVNELKANIVVLEQSILALKDVINKKDELISKQSREVAALRNDLLSEREENCRLLSRGIFERLFNL